MKSIAHRMIVFTVSAIAFGTVAFGQTRMTAEIPFAFRTATGTLPAGHYEITQSTGSGLQSMVYLWNAAAAKHAVAGQPVFDPYHTAGKRGASLDFACVAGSCRLAAIHTADGTLVYHGSDKSKRGRDSVAVISIPLKASNGD